MPTCNYCGADSNRPFTCNYCGHKHCPDHRLPERHNCTGEATFERTSGETNPNSQIADEEQQAHETLSAGSWRRHSPDNKSSSRSKSTNHPSSQSKEALREMGVLGRLQYRLSGYTTFRRPRASLVVRVFGVFLYPIAVIEAIIEVPIRIALLTAFSPLRHFSSIVATILTWILIVSVLLIYAPTGLIPEIEFIQQWRSFAASYWPLFV